MGKTNSVPDRAERRRQGAMRFAIRLIITDCARVRVARLDQDAMVSSLRNLFMASGSGKFHPDLRPGKYTDMVQMRFALTVEAQHLGDMDIPGCKADWYPQYAEQAKAVLAKR